MKIGHLNFNHFLSGLQPNYIYQIIAYKRPYYYKKPFYGKSLINTSNAIKTCVLEKPKNIGPKKPNITHVLEYRYIILEQIFQNFDHHLITCICSQARLRIVQAEVTRPDTANRKLEYCYK